MPGRDPGEPHRTATSLELLFDLCFVIAVAQASGGLSAAVAQGHPAAGVLRFAVVFFAIWWAWMNFTWFASAYDPDDVPYRLLVLAQITGSLVLAAGIPLASGKGDLRVVIWGYVVLRTALAVLWLRVARSDPRRGRTAVRFAAGVTGCQVGWVATLLVPDQVRLPAVAVLVAAEVCVPVWAQSAGMTPWHPRHIAERYELFLLIVLGESVAAAAEAVRGAFGRGHGSAGLYLLAAGGLLIVFAMWWLYFAKPAHTLLATSHRGARKRFVWAYGHYLVFAAAAAEGAGLAAYAEPVTRRGGGSVLPSPAGAAVTLPLAVFLLTVWAVHLRPHPHRRVERFAFPAAASAVVAASYLPAPALAAGLVAVALVVVTTAGAAGAAADTGPAQDGLPGRPVGRKRVVCAPTDRAAARRPLPAAVGARPGTPGRAPGTAAASREVTHRSGGRDSTAGSRTTAPRPKGIPHMGIVISSPLPDSERKTTGEALQGALVDLVDLSLVAKQAHWNLYGPRFRSVHLQLDEVVATAREFADEVAERAAAIGVGPDGRAATVAASSGLPAFPEGWIADEAVIGYLVEAFRAVTERMRTRIEATGSADPVSQDLLIGLTAALEKHSWMFQAENRH
ncbi:low temperature requirement protein A [Kitasatospora sp. NPDC056327]|uniref:low temperature requirement protein A n=1 Tax=Kitasatospora sp. NPDC056327 TaxID=3345785 RepID=UPI0035DE3D3C